MGTCQPRVREEGSGPDHAAQTSETSDSVRVEKVLALRRAIAEGTYRIPAEVLAESLFRSVGWSRTARQSTLG